MTGGDRKAVVADFREIEPPRNTLCGFFTLRLPSGLVLRGCTLHQKGEARWIGLPSAPQLDEDGRQRVDAATGKRLHTALVEIDDSKRRDAFRRLALDAVDRFFDAGRGRRR